MSVPHWLLLEAGSAGVRSHPRGPPHLREAIPWGRPARDFRTQLHTLRPHLSVVGAGYTWAPLSVLGSVQDRASSWFSWGLQLLYWSLVFSLIGRKVVCSLQRRLLSWSFRWGFLSVLADLGALSNVFFGGCGCKREWALNALNLNWIGWEMIVLRHGLPKACNSIQACQVRTWRCKAVTVTNQSISMERSPLT